MIKTIYSRAFSVLAKKPLALWGISLLNTFLIGVFTVLFGIAPGIPIIISILMNTAMTMIYLRGYRGKSVKAVNLFDCFKDWNTIKRVTCGMGWMYLWIFLWSLIPIAGPFIALVRTYQYRLTPYILVLEPEVPITEAHKVSAKRTHGYKFKMWGAEILISLIVSGINLVLYLLGLIPYIGVLFSLVSILFSICYAALSPLLLGLIQAAFYEEITHPSLPVAPAAPAAPAGGYPYGAPAPRAPRPTGAPAPRPAAPRPTGAPAPRPAAPRPAAPAPRPAAPRPANTFCPNCGSPLEAGSAFCFNCGQQLN